MDISVKYRKQVFIVGVPSSKVTLREFKQLVEKETGVLADSQMFAGLYKPRNKKHVTSGAGLDVTSAKHKNEDDCTLSELGVVFRNGRSVHCTLVSSQPSSATTSSSEHSTSDVMEVDPPMESSTTTRPIEISEHSDDDSDDSSDGNTDDGPERSRGQHRTRHHDRLFGVGGLGRGQAYGEMTVGDDDDMMMEADDYAPVSQTAPRFGPSQSDLVSVLNQLGTEAGTDPVSLLIASSGADMAGSGTFSTAMGRARTESRLLVLVIHNTQSEVSQSVMAQLFTSPAAVESMSERCVVWCRAGPPSDPDAGAQWLQNASRGLFLQQLPYVGICVVQGSQLNIVDILQGEFSVDEFVSRCISAIDAWGAQLDDETARALQKSEAHMLRDEQDEAYNEAVAADMEREMMERREKEALAQSVREAEEKRTREEQLAREQEAAAEKSRTELLERLKMQLGEEPAASPSVCSLQLRTQDGDRLIRKFESSAPLQHVIDFLTISGVAVSNCSLVQSYPRRVLQDTAQTLLDLGLHPSATLFLQKD